MSWKPISKEEYAFAQLLIKFIKVVRDTNSGQERLYYSKNWLPSDADISKSALLERMRSGLEPLAEPPPLGYSCPWYAVVEDAGPHYLYDCYFKEDETIVHALQHVYNVVEKSEYYYIVKDAKYDTSYRFKIFYDSEWEHPTAKILGKGAWFIRNMEFENED